MKFLRGGIINVVPQDTYRPQIKVTIDFAHKFVDSGVNQPGTNVVDPRVLERETQRIFNFAQRYFQYEGSVGEQFGLDVHDTIDPTDINIKGAKLHVPLAPANTLQRVRYLNNILNYFLTSVNVTRTRNAIGNASLRFKGIKNPIHKSPDATGNNRIFFNSVFDKFNQIISPMLPIKIWAKGRLYRNWWFPIFDGYVFAVSPTDSGGFVEFQIECKDVLELARTSIEMLKPALIPIAEDESKTKNYVNILSKVFQGYDHFKIIKAMILGDPIEYDPDAVVKQSMRILKKSEKAARAANAEAVSKMQALENFVHVTDGSNVDPLLAALEDRAIHEVDAGTDLSYMINKTAHGSAGPDQIAGTPRKLVTWGAELTPYRVMEFVSPKLFDSTFSSRLDIISQVAKTVYFEHVEKTTCD